MGGGYAEKVYPLLFHKGASFGMKIMKQRYWTVLGILVLCIGCSKDESVRAVDASRTNATPERVFAVVNGESVTEDDVRTAIMVQAKSMELAGQPIAEKHFARWANAAVAQMIGGLINTRLMEQEIRREKLEVLPEDREKVLKVYSERTAQEVTSVELLAEKFGELKDAVRRQFETSVGLAAYERVHWTDSVSDAFVRQYYALMSNDFQRVQAIDAEAHVKADKAYARLKSGEAWNVVALSSEDTLDNPAAERYARDWTWVGEDAMGITALAAALPTMKVGEFTAPLDTPYGLMIVKLLEKDKKLYHLSRILFRMAEPVNLPDNEADVRTIIVEQLRDSRRASTLERLQKSAKIEYPMGTNITYQIWKEEVSK